jgi:hypothetical protein
MQTTDLPFTPSHMLMSIQLMGRLEEFMNELCVLRLLCYYEVSLISLLACCFANAKTPKYLGF